MDPTLNPIQGPIDLEETEVTDQDNAPIDLTSDVSNQQVDVDVAKQRSNKAHFGLGDNSPGLDVLNYSIANGTEDRAREDAVIKDGIQKKQLRLQLTQDIILNTPPELQTPELVNSIMGMTDQEAANPKSFFEREYARKVVTTGLTSKENDVVSDANKESPEASDLVMSGGERVLTRKEVAQRIAEELQGEIKASGWGSYGADLAQQFVPFWSQYNQTNAMYKGSGFLDNMLLGRNKMGQALAYYTEENDAEAEKMLRTAVESIKKTNLLDAQAFANYMAGATFIDTFMDNAISAADWSIVGAGALKTGLRATASGLEKAATLQKATKDIVKAAGGRNTVPEAVIEASGDLQTAYTATALKKLEEVASGLNRSDSMDKLKGELFTISNPRDIITGQEQSLSAAGALKMQGYLETNAKNLTEATLSRPLDIEMAARNSATMEAAVDDALENFKLQSTRASDAILNIEPRKMTVEDRQILNVAAEIELNQARLMQQVNKQNKMQDLIDYTFFMNEYQAAVAGGLKAPVKNPGSFRTGFKDTKASVGNSQFWRKAAENVARQEADDAVKDRMLNALAFFSRLSKQDKKLFETIMRADAEIAMAPKVLPIKPDVRVVKDLGNALYAGIKVGRNPRSLPDMPEWATLKLGNAHDATLFDTAKQADFWAKDVYGLAGYKIEQQGTGFYIEVYKPLDFTSDTVRDALAIDIKNGKTPDQINKIMGFIQNAEYTNAKSVMSDRHLATFGLSAQGKVIADALKEVNKLPGAISKYWRDGSRKDFTKFISNQRTADVPGSDMPGKFSANYADFEKEWHSTFKRLPTEQEGRAYWSYVALSNTEFAVTNLRIYGAKARMGWENHTFQGGMPALEGKFLKDGIPRGLREDAGVMVITDNGNRFFRTMGGGQKRPLGGTRGTAVPTQAENLAYMDRLESEGYKVVQIHQYSEDSLRKFAKTVNVDLPEGEINYVLTKNLKSSPMDYTQIPNRPGGHHHYVAQFYLRQPKIRHMADSRDPNKVNTKYYGDFNIAGFETYKEVVQWQKNFEKSRLMYLDYKKGKITKEQFNDFASSNMPYSGKTMIEHFDTGYFNASVPFYSTPANQTVDKAHKLSSKYPAGRFTRAADSELDMFKDIDLKNAMERGDTLRTIASVGSKENPAFKFETARMLDPLPTIERMAGSVMRGRYIEDLKWKEAERFIAEFGDMLKPSPAELRRDPLRHLYEGDFDMTRIIDRERLNAAVAFRRSSLEFLQLRSDVSRDMQYLNQIATDTLLGKGRKIAHKVLDPWNRHSDINVNQKAKNAAFHAYMSFNPSQFFKQAQAMVSIMGIKAFTQPGRIPQLFPSVSMMQFEHLFGSRSTLDFSAKMVEKTTLGSFKADHFKEMWDGMKRYGFDNVGYERADMAEYMDPNLIKGVWGKTLDYGAIPVQAGERITRHSAWVAAYDEWRQANKLAKFNEDAIKQVGDRAHLMIGDMTRAANAPYQAGFMGLTTQFMPFNIRLFEQMFNGLVKGERLTRKEAAGVLVMNSLMYGVPTGLGIMALGVPAAEDARKWALKNGYEPENFVTRMGFYGLLNEMIRPIVGGDTNIGERYGPGNMSLIRDFFWGDKSSAAMLMGMSGTYLRDTLYAMDPYRMFVADVVGGSEKIYTPTFEDHIRVLSTLSVGFNTADKLQMALKTGDWMTRNGVLMETNVSPMEAMFKALGGIDPQRIADIPKIKDVMRDDAERQRKLEPMLRREYSAAITAFRNDDDANGYLHHTNMMAIIAAGGWSAQERPSLLARIGKGLEGDVDEVSRKFSMKSRPRLDAFLKRIERKQ